MTASWLVLAVTLTISLLAAPLAAEAQVSGRVPRVGYLGFERWTTPEPFEQALKDLGWEDGRNIIVEMRFTLDPERVPTLAAELVRLNCDVIVAPDEVRINAIRQATHTIPIVFFAVGDPVAVGYAASLRRPGGDVPVDGGGRPGPRGRENDPRWSEVAGDAVQHQPVLGGA
jgi:putative tryptophan/tyrosine transport system substrate-binding protein